MHTCIHTYMCVVYMYVCICMYMAERSYSNSLPIGSNLNHKEVPMHIFKIAIIKNLTVSSEGGYRVTATLIHCWYV